MTKRLILIRHAKSGWDDPLADDHARVLTKRGRAASAAIGCWMTAHGYQPDIILCSDASRTVETAELIVPELQSTPRLALTAALYHAAPSTVIDLVRQQSADTIGVIGHNPGIGMAADMLVENAPNHPRFNDYPTCAITVIDFDVNAWGDIKASSGACVNFTVPRDLIGSAGHETD